MLIPGLILAGAAFWATRNIHPEVNAKKDSLRRIRERGFLIAMTGRNTLDYFLYKGEPMGYQLEMIRSFADHLGVPVKFIAGNDIHKLTYYLENNAADIIALNLPVTGEGKKIAAFTKPFGETRLVVVQSGRQGNLKAPRTSIRKLNEFPADTVYVQANPFFTPLYHVFYKKTGKKAILKPVTGISQEELIRWVASGKIRYALCAENTAMVYHRTYPGLDISLLAFPLFSYGWGLSRHSDSLAVMLSEWMAETDNASKLKKIYLSYFQSNRINQYFRSPQFSVMGNRISPFDDAIRQHSKIVMWDWRLVASLIYQESNFQTGLTSKRNAHGLMQLMPATASRFGIDSASTPSRQIAGGVKYLKYIDQQLPREITDPIERVYFVLATYNVGIGRVMAARAKAEKYGKDKNRWNHHVDYYLLRRSRKDPYGQTDTTSFYPVYYKTEGFVDDVVSRFYHYRNLIDD